MLTRINIASDASFEDTYGYSRAVKVGDTVYIAGTLGYDYAAGACDPDPAAQVRQIVRNFEAALDKAGASLADIVQLTTYIASTEVFEAIGPTLREVFGDIRPTNTALVVAFPIPLAKVEISAIAVIGASR